ncbi:MAG: glycosyltransferase [Peptococcaceae bacterium]|nr:glycosyltransferase [Peptococcaceae bacterium]
MKKILVWETLSLVAGGQKMTLTVLDMLKDKYVFHCLIPEKGVLSNELDKRGISYTLMGNQTMPTGIKGKSMIFRYGWLSLKAVARGIRVINRENPDIIYAPGPAALPWSAFCGLLRGKSVIWHLHHLFLDGATIKLINFCSGWKSVKKIISVSNIVGEQINNSKGKVKKITIYNPVDSEKYTNGDGNTIFSELGIDRNGKLIIGQIALLQPSKRQDVVIRTVEELWCRGVNAYAFLVGQTREEDKSYQDRLLHIVEEKGIEDRVFFLGQRNDVPNILSAIDVLMIPSSFEGFPLAGLEACAAGVPVLGADIGGSREFIEVSQSGRCFEYDNAEEAATAVVDVLTSEIRKIVIENGVKFSKQHTMDAYKSDIARVFCNVV